MSLSMCGLTQITLLILLKSISIFQQLLYMKTISHLRNHAGIMLNVFKHLDTNTIYILLSAIIAKWKGLKNCFNLMPKVYISEFASNNNSNIYI